MALSTEVKVKTDSLTNRMLHTLRAKLQDEHVEYIMTYLDMVVTNEEVTTNATHNNYGLRSSLHKYLYMGSIFYIPAKISEEIYMLEKQKENFKCVLK